MVSQLTSHMVKPFERPHVPLRMEFMNKHPIQAALPFRTEKAYYRKVKTGGIHFEVVNRSWLQIPPNIIPYFVRCALLLVKLMFVSHLCQRMVSQTGAIHTSVSRSMNKLNTTKMCIIKPFS